MRTTNEMIAFLHAFIAEEKKGDKIISEEGENAVEKIAYAFLERADELIQTKEYLEAAWIVFNSLTAWSTETFLVENLSNSHKEVGSCFFDLKMINWMNRERWKSNSIAPGTGQKSSQGEYIF